MIDSLKSKQLNYQYIIVDKEQLAIILSIQNIITYHHLSGWYTFTGRIDSLEEVVQGFAETSDIELVGQKLDSFEKDIDYLKERIDAADLSDIKGDIVELQGEVKNLSRSIRSVSKSIETHEVDFHGDPLNLKINGICNYRTLYLNL